MADTQALIERANHLLETVECEYRSQDDPPGKRCEPAATDACWDCRTEDTLRDLVAALSAQEAAQQEMVCKCTRCGWQGRITHFGKGWQCPSCKHCFVFLEPEEFDSLRLERDAVEAVRLRDNAHLLARAEAAEAKLAAQEAHIQQIVRTALGSVHADFHSRIKPMIAPELNTPTLNHVLAVIGHANAAHKAALESQSSPRPVEEGPTP